MKRLKIFLYEDDVYLSEMLKTYLSEHLGHQISLYRNEKEALAAAKVSSFDFYILSHWWGQNLNPLLDIIDRKKIIILSTSFLEEMEESLKSYKIFHKPFNLDSFDAVFKD